MWPPALARRAPRPLSAGPPVPPRLPPAAHGPRRPFPPRLPTRLSPRIPFPLPPHRSPPRCPHRLCALASRRLDLAALPRRAFPRPGRRVPFPSARFPSAASRPRHPLTATLVPCLTRAPLRILTRSDVADCALYVLVDLGEAAVSAPGSSQELDEAEAHDGLLVERERERRTSCPCACRCLRRLRLLERALLQSQSRLRSRIRTLHP